MKFCELSSWTAHKKIHDVYYDSDMPIMNPNKGTIPSEQNYKRNFVEQIQLDKVDSFTLQHKSKLLQIQTHLVFQPIKTGVCGNLITCSNTKWGFSEISNIQIHWYHNLSSRWIFHRTSFFWNRIILLVNLLAPPSEPNLGNFVQLRISSGQKFICSHVAAQLF